MDSFWQIVYEDEYKEMKSLYPDIPEKDLWILILTKDNISSIGKDKFIEISIESNILSGWLKIGKVLLILNILFFVILP